MCTVQYSDWEVLAEGVCQLLSGWQINSLLLRFSDHRIHFCCLNIIDNFETTLRKIMQLTASTFETLTTMKYLQADCLRDDLSRGDRVVLLDCRGNEEYRRGHIQGAYNIVLPQIMLRRLKTNKLPLKNLVPPCLKQDKDAFLSRLSSSLVVVYDRYSAEASDNDLPLPILLFNRMAHEGCRVAILKGKSIQYFISVELSQLH